MALDTNTKKARTSFDKLIDLYWGGTERRISGLTLRIIGINILSLAVLMIGVINLGRYETEILATKLETFQKETTVIANNFANIDINTANLNEKVKILKRKTGHDIIILNTHKEVVAQTTSPFKAPLQIPHRKSISLEPLKTMTNWVITLAPNRKELPSYPQTINKLLDIKHALNGETSITAWQTPEKSIVLSGAASITNNEQITGAVYILRSGQDIVQDISSFWGQMLQIFIITLTVTTLISIYLSGTIARPLRKLARAAQAIRKSNTKTIEIPDLSDRYDEIGELSLVMRDMTESLWQRMDSIERFAADISHELKNPLTSLKSAVETLKRAKKKQDQEKLLDVLQHDIERMDRLITDIAATSRLDTELSRKELESVNITEILKNTQKRYENLHNQSTKILLNIPQSSPLWILGFEDKLIQVLDNLISNALSFSNNDDTIKISAIQNKKTTKITIEDQGPGVPGNKLETIFERFYTERPESEDFGRHSGLGLSICKQIIEALGGLITAENITSLDGNTIGARFSIALLNKNENT